MSVNPLHISFNFTKKLYHLLKKESNISNCWEYAIEYMGNMAVFLFFGEDTYTLEKKLAFWRSEFEKKYGGDMNISILEGDKVTANDIFQNCCAMPFLAEKRFVLVKNFFSEGEDGEKTIMADFIEKIPDSCVLVFSETTEVDKRISLYKRIQKFGTLNEFQPIAGSKLLGWIEKEVTKRGGVIEKEAIIFLTELIPSDMYRLENEIAKLIAYANSRAITRKDVELLVDIQFDTSIFRLTDGIGQKNQRIALDTLHQLMESGEDLHRVLYMIMRQFRIITCVKDLVSKRASKEEIISKLKEHPFVISNTMTQARNFSLDQLKHAYALLVEIDMKLKSGGIKVLAGDNREFVLALDRLVLDLCS